MTVLTPPPRKYRYREVTQIATSLVELYATAEILCYFLRDEHLHDLAVQWWDTLRDKLEYKQEIARTLRMIRRLPE